MNSANPYSPLYALLRDIRAALLGLGTGKKWPLAIEEPDSPDGAGWIGFYDSNKGTSHSVGVHLDKEPKLMVSFFGDMVGEIMHQQRLITTNGDWEAVWGEFEYRHDQKHYAYALDFTWTLSEEYHSKDAGVRAGEVADKIRQVLRLAQSPLLQTFSSHQLAQPLDEEEIESR